MTAEFAIALMTAFWLGILTSISPCPLATNIAAVSYIGRDIGNRKKVLISGLLYSAGRILAYLILGYLIVLGLLSIPEVSHFLQKYMNKMLGPILIISGMFLLEMLSFTSKGGGMSEKFQKKVDSLGIWGAFALGLVFALSFCPLSAALFFGSLVPIAVKTGSGILLPSAYGLATGIPVIAFGFIIALGAGKLGKAFNRISLFEKYARWTTGIIFIIVGIYYSLVNIFGVSFFSI
ncbi:MAG TPA: cytochrome C biogenesis protein [Lentisphaeria bacterium]|nr:MAG: cytochrome C biogenesis protein [Lentisphaerae bacterium GWF2_49_21]HBC87622.1 cytochrome C biogenesis protein [Lentisphaeria bacterium]